MELIPLVKHFEGFQRVVEYQDGIGMVAKPYVCPAGYWTIGWGHLCKKDHPLINREQGEIYLRGDLEMSAMAVDNLIRVPLTRGQRDALTSWTFNLGASRLRGSTLRAQLNRGDYDRVPTEMRRWVYAAGEKLGGLIARREAEVALWKSA